MSIEWEDVAPDKPVVCEHGSLRRKCMVCELTDERESMTKERDSMREERDEARAALHEYERTEPLKIAERNGLRTELQSIRAALLNACDAVELMGKYLTPHQHVGHCEICNAKGMVKRWRKTARMYCEANDKVEFSERSEASER